MEWLGREAMELITRAVKLMEKYDADVCAVPTRHGVRLMLILHGATFIGPEEEITELLEKQ